ncbi:hypothetical protein llap_13192 [Limosa lapponica baueri]|uniref:Uncharacterized protein n=1 Tax=Limosa lapponica baueri TaxID=1758121 RepID=A0A2I0TRR3_LIMLA|nr:hypothetical protein llap_13192 [Limosa lapponica baueri]
MGNEQEELEAILLLKSYNLVGGIPCSYRWLQAVQKGQARKKGWRHCPLCQEIECEELSLETDGDRGARQAWYNHINLFQLGSYTGRNQADFNNKRITEVIGCLCDERLIPVITEDHGGKKPTEEHQTLSQSQGTPGPGRYQGCWMKITKSGSSKKLPGAPHRLKGGY